MKILVLAPQPFFQNRGTPIAVKVLCQVLAKHGHCITLLSYHEGEDIALANVEHIRIPEIPGIKGVRPGFSWKKVVCDMVMGAKCLFLLRELKVDVIHAVEESAFMAAAFRLLFGLPYIYDMDSSLSNQITTKFRVLQPFKPLLDALERAAIRGSVGVIAVCRSLEETVRQQGGQGKVLRLEDFSLLEESTEPAEDLRASLGLKGPVVMYVGNLESYQGIDLLLESVRLAVAEVADIELVFVGGSSEGISHYRHRADELNISNRAHFIGERPMTQLRALLNQADILVSPRITGGNTPMKIYSYLASGKPLLATRLLTHTQVLDDDVAELVDPEPEAMSQGMIRLLRNRERSAILGRNGQKRANAEHSYFQFESKLVHFYNTVHESMRMAKTGLHRMSKA